MEELEYYDSTVGCVVLKLGERTECYAYDSLVYKLVEENRKLKEEK